MEVKEIVGAIDLRCESIQVARDELKGGLNEAQSGTIHIEMSLKSEVQMRIVSQSR